MIYLYKAPRFYATFLKLLGYERGIGSFIDTLDLNCPNKCRILDIACGSGIVGLRLLERFPRSTLLATDLERNFLRAALSKAREWKIDENRITVGLSDISHPKKVTLLDGSPLVLEENSFDIVSVGGALGYSKNQPETLRELLRLIKPGGYLVNLEMNEGPMGKLIGFSYDCRPIPLDEIQKTVENEGHNVSMVPFAMRDFPANLTRVGIIVKKSALKAKPNFANAPVEVDSSEVQIDPLGSEA